MMTLLFRVLAMTFVLLACYSEYMGLPMEKVNNAMLWALFNIGMVLMEKDS